MLNALIFQVTAADPGNVPNRADVACFVGFIGRRRGAAMTPAARTRLLEHGWIDGPWGIDRARVSELLHLPVTVDSWEEFAQMYAWEQRELRAGSLRTCCTYLGAAVRSFFARGGRRAVIVRCGDPWSYLGGPSRKSQRRNRLHELLPWSFGQASRPFDAGDPSRWRGLEHVYGLDEASHVCMPDLADLLSTPPVAQPKAPTPPPPPEVFVECNTYDPPAIPDNAMRRISAPRLELEGYKDWHKAVDAAHRFIARAGRGEMLFASSLPLPAQDATVETRQGATVLAQADMAGFLHACGAFEPVDNAEGRDLRHSIEGAASAYVQLAWPWLRTVRSLDLPGQLEPPEGVLAGCLAANALGRGTFRSVAGTVLGEVLQTEPQLPGISPGTSTERLSKRLCVIGPEPEGPTLLSDATTSIVSAWRAGGTSRLMSAVLRCARRVGADALFEPNGPELWGRIRRDMEALLEQFRMEGGLGGNSADEAYQVRCDRSVMSQNDLDNGRVLVEISLLPVAAIERIVVVLDLHGAREVADAAGEVA